MARKRFTQEGSQPFTIFSSPFAFIRVHSRLFSFSVLALVAGSVLAQGGKSGTPAKAAASTAPAYKDVQAVLKARCVVCHSQQMLSNTVISGGLALDTYAAVKKGVVGDKGGHAILVAGKSEDSELIKRLVATSPTKLMPKGGPALPPAQIALFKKWVDAGAPGPAGEEATANPGADILPMPALVGTQDVNWKTRIALAPDVLGKTTPKNPMLAFAFKIGPLPPLTAVAFAPDGKHLAVGGYRAVTLWDMATGKPTAALTGLSGPVQALAFRPDGAQLAVASGNPGVSGEVKIVDAKTLLSAGPMLTGHADVVFGVAWNSKGTQLVTGSQDKTARIWEWPTGKEKLVLKDHSDAVTKVCFAPDDKSVYTASLDHNARRFDVNDGKVLRVFTGHADGITALAINLKGDRIVTAGPEPELRWWNVDTGRRSHQSGRAWRRGQRHCVQQGRQIRRVRFADHTVRLWDGNSTGGLRSLEGANDWMYAAAISPDDKFVAGVGADGIANLWEAANGTIARFACRLAPVRQIHRYRIRGHHAGRLFRRFARMGRAPASRNLPEWIRPCPNSPVGRKPCVAGKCRQGLAGRGSGPRQNRAAQTVVPAPAVTPAKTSAASPAPDKSK